METNEFKPVWQLPNGKWRHVLSDIEWPDRYSAAMDYRFTCEWELVQSNNHTESDFQ